MHQFYSFSVDDISVFKTKILQLSNIISNFCYLDANNYSGYPYANFGSFFAIDALTVFSYFENDTDILSKFEQFRRENKSWLFGFLSYDLKNNLEKEQLKSNNFDGIKNPVLHFFVPKYIVKIEQEKVEIGVVKEKDILTFKALINQEFSELTEMPIITIQNRIKKEQYLETVLQIQQQIRKGNIYEMNFCQEFYAENTPINPINTFKKLNRLSQAPFSCFFRNDSNYLMCASPERFLKKQHLKLISQPIKGTRKRNSDLKEDNQAKQELFFNEKERSENVMIVDLVRNDFSKIAKKNSVEVEELFGLYTFKQVHQLISTISCKINEKTRFQNIIEALFPMGSMTGAPKISAMQLIEQFEQTKRGLFSGAVGYITPKGNFDFNVVIRSILYNSQNQYVSIQTGSAITIDANAEQEYEECFIKAQAMFDALR